MADSLQNLKQPPEIILLDYVQTLVENASDSRRHELQRLGRYRDWIKLERFREYLLSLLIDYQHRGGKVLIVTARSSKYANETIEQIRAHGQGFWPNDAYFNPGEMLPPMAKLCTLERKIFPEYGLPTPTRYLALESNASTRAMYAKLNIAAMPVSYGAPWAELPQLPLKLTSVFPGQCPDSD